MSMFFSNTASYEGNNFFGEKLRKKYFLYKNLCFSMDTCISWTRISNALKILKKKAIFVSMQGLNHGHVHGHACN